MKKIKVFSSILLLMFLILPLVSAEITINQQPEEIYNLGETISVPITISTKTEKSDFLNMELTCEGEVKSLSQGIISLKENGIEDRKIILPLEQKFIDNMKGKCSIKVLFDGKSTSTKSFKISNKITLNAELSKTEVNPNESISIEGRAIREDGNPVKGFIEASISHANTTHLTKSEKVNEESFSLSIDIPKNMAAGAYILRLKVHELDTEGEITNEGFLNKNIRINQIPTSLEIFFGEKIVEPGTDLEVKTILHDQTGEEISSTTFLTIKNQKGKIVEEKEAETGEFIKFWIAKNELPGEWTVVSESGEFDASSVFRINKKEAIKIEILNKTLIITNTGNVPYNQTVFVKLGNETLRIKTNLGLEESQMYRLSAPDGHYEVEVISGNSSLSQEMILTGNAIDIKKVSGGIMWNPVVWIFIIFLLGFVAFIVFKRGYQRTFVGYIRSKVGRKGKKKIERKKEENAHHQSFSLSKSTLVNPGNKAEFSLSIKGEKQNVDVIALSIKNIEEIHSKKSNAKETIQEIVNFAESHKAVTYESNNIVFFILSPTKTKTFKNELAAIEIAKKMKGILSHHNKMFKQKINFGISLNYGTIVAKQDRKSGVFTFMSLGTLMTAAKKISSIAEKDVLISEKMNDRLRSFIKTEKHEKKGISVFSIKEIKTNNEDYKKFIRKFLERQEKEKPNSKDQKKDK